ncbi:MAG: creatininase family protein [Ktedonobacteraceae bacterium]|nr:creatininase family protein [Ktedonobacteraceae bacterium]
MYINPPMPQLHQRNRMVVLLPIGSYEQHGPHLPTDTDLRIAQLIAERLLKTFPQDEAILLPAIPFSCSWEHKGLGTIALNTSTISSLLYDIAFSLKSWGTPLLLVLVNWHGGNGTLASLTTEITARENIPATVIQTLSLASRIWQKEEDLLFPDVHAGMIETSIVQAYWPDLVARFDEIDFIPDIKPVLPQSVFQTLGIRAISKTGIWGKPQQSNPEKGNLVIDAVVKDIFEQVVKLLELLKTYSA